jgi:hypothetical protein
MDHAMDELQRLYDSEINFAIETLWDEGFTVRIGDKKNGYRLSTTVKTFEEAVACSVSRRDSTFRIQTT